VIEPGRPPLLDAAARRPLVLDAAMGTRLLARGLDLAHDDPCLWNLAHPDAVRAVHVLDLAAGADAVLTNTFGANRRWLSRYGRAGDAVAINRRAAALAREAAGPDRFVIGSFGPTGADDPHAGREQAEALAGAGVDALLFETHRFDQALASLAAARGLDSLPRLVSLLAWPEPVADAVRRLEDLGASAVGENCQRGMQPALATAERLAPVTSLPLWMKPSAGLPDEPQETPEAFAAAVPALLTSGVRFLGGCCGTTEAHVAALRKACYALLER
jgi:methionine synthase I (cobalamin-dependent)